MQSTRYEELVRQLASLSPDERRAVVQEADARAEHASGERDASHQRRRDRWRRLRELSGVVNFGGNAVEDCDRAADG